MAHGFNSMIIKREIDCNSASNINSNHQIPQQTIISAAAALVNNNNNNTNSAATVTTTGSVATSATDSIATATTVSSSPTTSTIQQQNCGSAKMGSRRIFTPQFKLQVLESYRNDSDCKGNQRATARKYGIHRRQIQKWLQCETNLRSSVANLNQNSVKHQFHNISHHHHSHQTLPTTVAAAAAAATTPSTVGTNSNNLHHQHHNQHYQHLQQQQHHQQQQYKVNNLPLDTTRHSVALTPVTLSAVAAPQLSVTPTTTQSAAAAAVIPSAIVRATTTTIATAAATAATKCINGSTHHHNNNNNKTTIKLSTTTTRPGTPIIPIQPAAAAAYRMNVAAVGGNLVPVECSTAALLTHTPAITSIPLVVSHYHHSHHHNQHQQQQQQQQHIENRLLMPSASLPLPVLGSPVSTATNRTNELRDYQPITVTGNCYNMNEADYRNLPIYENLHYYNGRSVAGTIGGGGGVIVGGSVASSVSTFGVPVITAAAATTPRMDCGTVATAAPIDLSLNFRRREVSENHRRHEQSDHSDSITATGNSIEGLCYNNMIKMAATETSSWHKIVADNSNDSNNNRDKYDEENKKIDLSLYGSSHHLHHHQQHQESSHAVDLTCRKRKNVGSDNSNSVEDETEVSPPEKIQKTSNIDEETDTVARGSSSFAAAAAVGGGGQDDAGEKQNENNNNNHQQQAKPVKLFKPYLLDDDDNERKYSINSSEQRDPIIWSHHLTCITSGVGSAVTAAAGAINVGAYDGNSPQQQQGGGGGRSDNFSLISPTTTTNVDKFTTFQQQRQSTMETGSPTFHTQQQQQSTYIDRTTTSTPISPQSSIASHSPSSTSSSSSYWCSKGFTAGSPVSSGYESASSFSDSSDYYRSPPPQSSSSSSHHLQTSYSIDLKMQPIDSYYNHDLTGRADQLTAINGKYEIAHAHASTTRTNVVQKWLDPEANIRQGITLYV